MGFPRVLLADDSLEIHRKVTQVIQDDVSIIGSVQTGEQAIASAIALQPDLLILDISMPGMNGIRAVSQLRQLSCGARVIFLTVHEDQDYIDAAFSAGALGYVFKSQLASDLIPAVQSVLDGNKFISSSQGRLAANEKKKPLIPRALFAK